MEIRQAKFAGTFYPEEASVLKEMVDGFINESASVKLPEKGKLKAIIVPHAGYIYSGIVAGAGFKLITNDQVPITKKAVVIIGPSHNEYFEGAVTDDSDFWENPLGKVKLGKLDAFKKFGEAHKNEHSIEVQIPFLQRTLKNFEIIPIMTGEAEPKLLAEELLRLKDAFFVISSDLSHYYPYDEAVEIDRAACEAIPTLDIGRTEKEVEACGKTGILTIMQMAKNLGWKGRLIDYQNSGDTAGDKMRVVGYGCYGFYE